MSNLHNTLTMYFLGSLRDKVIAKEEAGGLAEH